MKRRDFLAASAQLSAMAIPAVALGETRPCPPQTLQVSGGTARSIECTAAAPAGSADWFAEAAEKQWVEIAGATQQQLRTRYQEDPNPDPFGTANGMLAYSGACIDQERKEILMIANGGHGDGSANEGYALDLTSASPSWVRLNDRTPWYIATGGLSGTVHSSSNGANLTEFDCTQITRATGSFEPRQAQRDAAYAIKFTSGALDGTIARIETYQLQDGRGRFGVSLATSTNKDGSLKPLPSLPEPGTTFTVVEYLIDKFYYPRTSTTPAVYGDGRPRAMHTCNNQWFANGRVWFPIQNSIASGAGAGCLGIVSYNRDMLRGIEPLPWTRTNLGPWTIHGSVPFDAAPTMANLIFCPAQLDTHTGLIWYLAGKGTSDAYWSVDTATGACKLYRTSPNWFELASMWSVLIPGADPSGNGASIIVMGQLGSQNVYVFRPAFAGKTMAKMGPFQTGPALDWGNPAGGFAARWGAVFHKPSSAVLAYNSDGTFDMGRDVRKLSVPLDSNGILQQGGVWTWKTVSLGGVTPASRSNGVYSRFNLVRDLGGRGADALVLITGVDNPVYVCKLTSSVA